MTGSKHGASAIATLREAGIHIVVLFHTLVVGGGSLLTKRPGDSEGAARSVTVFLEGQLGTGKSLPCLFFTFIYAIALTKSEGQFSNENTG